MNPYQSCSQNYNEENKQKIKGIIFQSQNVKKISINQQILQVTIWQSNHLKKFQNSKDVFKTQFDTKNFNSLQSIQIDVYQIKLPKINAPFLNQFWIHVQKSLPLNQFASSIFQSLKQIAIISEQMLTLPRFNTPQLSNIYVSCNQEQLAINDFCEGNYPQLLKITFQANKIGRFPLLKNSIKLAQIQIQSNEINSLEEFAKGNYPQLKIIKASGNSMTQLPQFKNCPLIQELSFSENSIKSIDMFSQGKYPNLKQLSLSFNKIKQIPLIDCQNLQVLYLNDNKIKSVDKLAKFKYQKLKYIQLSNNFLTLIPFINAPILQNFILDHNKIVQCNHFYQKNLVKYEHLKYFQSRQNLITKIPILFLFSNSKNLINLDVRNCKIDNIEMLSQIQLCCASQINLQSNKIVSFSIFHKLKLPSIKRIFLMKNLSYERNSMPKAQIGCYQHQNLEQIIIYEDTHDGGHSLNWILKNFAKKININGQINYHKSIKRKGKQAFSKGFNM